MENFVETVDMEKVWTLFAANKKKTFVAVLIPPAVRVCIGEGFGLARGEDAVGKVAGFGRGRGSGYCDCKRRSDFGASESG